MQSIDQDDGGSSSVVVPIGGEGNTIQPGPSFVHADLQLRRSPVSGLGHFATKKIPKGEVLVIWRGRDVDKAGVMAIPLEEEDYTLQLDEDRFQIATVFGVREPADYVNHSCDPNGGFNGETTLVAMRDIEPGEEITFDYAMAEVIMNCIANVRH
eukprot:TRINITY_DN2005_c0_g1_i2.p1 TRINITY_DN2005_c0_g1~~TRINITY_DN2005_c0_g1_i2.p1  ORF type:complete len:155 (-),score=32.71 TRINITY_DN2005_c0_g1_i2:255-719(-)